MGRNMADRMPSDEEEMLKRTYDVVREPVTLETLKEVHLYGSVKSDLGVLIIIADKSFYPDVLRELITYLTTLKSGSDRRELARVIAKNVHTSGRDLDSLARAFTNFHFDVDIAGNIAGNRNTFDSTLGFIRDRFSEKNENLENVNRATRSQKISFAWVGKIAERNLEARMRQRRARRATSA